MAYINGKEILFSASFGGIGGEIIEEYDGTVVIEGVAIPTVRIEEYDGTMVIE